MRNQLRRQASVADAAHLVAVPSKVTDHLRALVRDTLGDGGQEVGGGEDLESLTDQFTVLAEDHARVEPGLWQRARRAINQRERLRVRYQRFDGVTRDYLLEPYHLHPGAASRVAGQALATDWYGLPEATASPPPGCPAAPRSPIA